MNAPTPRLRLRALVAIVAGTTLLGGCQVISPRQTEVMYDAGDGVSANVGDLQLRNLLVVAEKDGGPGTVSAAVGNQSDKPVTITFATVDGGQATTEVPAHSTVNVSEGAEKVTLPAVKGAPGSMTELVISGPGGNAPVQVPVLPPTGYYEGLRPSAAPSAG